MVADNAKVRADRMRKAFDYYVDTVIKTRLGEISDEMRETLWCVWLDGSNYGIMQASAVWWWRRIK